MIRPISNINFKSANNQQLTEKEINSAIIKQTSFKSDRPRDELVSIGVGAVVGLSSSFAKKGYDKSIVNGLAAYCATSMAFGLLEANKRYSDGKEYAKKYGNIDLDKANITDKVRYAFTLPPAIDFGSEEKNKEYFKFQLNRNKQQLENTGIGLGLGGLVTLAGSAISLAAKKTKGYGISAVAGLVAATATMCALGFKNDKDEKQAASVEQKAQVEKENETIREEKI